MITVSPTLHPHPDDDLQPVLTMEEMEAIKALKYRSWTTKVGR